MREDRAMKLRLAARVTAAILAISLAPGESFGQADPYWMRSWNEAQRTRPQAMASTGRIAPAGEPGTPLVIHGLVVEPDGRTPASGVIVHAYHRDRDGFDFGPNDTAVNTWRLQGWAKTGADGRFEFRTIRPAPDHLGREGSHVHFTLETPQFGRQWAHKILFADDPLVTDSERRRSAEAEDFAWVRKVSVVQGVQQVDVKLRIKTTKDF
jgi:protocatechuate 3,4-dioxygenase beta subunit